jgi:hypothetical protein
MQAVRYQPRASFRRYPPPCKSFLAKHWHRCVMGLMGLPLFIECLPGYFSSNAQVFDVFDFFGVFVDTRFSLPNTGVFL